MSQKIQFFHSVSKNVGYMGELGSDANRDYPRVLFLEILGNLYQYFNFPSERKTNVYRKKEDKRG